MKLLRRIYNKRLAYLDALARIYTEKGYICKVDGQENILSIYTEKDNEKECPEIFLEGVR